MKGRMAAPWWAGEVAEVTLAFADVLGEMLTDSGHHLGENEQLC
jgi:hypothetical protein